MSDFILTTKENTKFLYLLLVVPLIMFQVFFTPPFQTPDSPNNFDRAYQVSKGLLIGRRLHGISGGYLNNNIIATESVFNYIPFHYNHKLTYNALHKAQQYRWTKHNKRQYTFSSFPNTSVYPPFFYLPQALAIGIGRFLNLSIIDTYRLALIFVSLCAIFITYKALSINSRITPAIFFVAALPMVTCLYAAMESDALLISTGLLLAAFIDRRLSKHEHGKHDLLYISLMILLLSIQKPPYIGLTFLLFAPSLIVSSSYGIFKRILFSSAITAVVLAWIIYAKVTAWVNIDPSHKSLASHLIYILTHPADFFIIFFRTIHSQSLTYLHQMIGVLGWLDAPFPSTYYSLAGGAFIIAALLSSAAIRLKDWVFVLLSILSSSFMIFVALYTDWSPVKSTIIEGVQGRYFLPLLPLFFTLLYPTVCSHGCIIRSKAVYSITSIRPSTWSFISHHILSAAYAFLYLLFPLITFIFSSGVIIDRYYLFNKQAPSVTIETSNKDQRALPVSQMESVNLLLRAPFAPYGASQLKEINILMATYSGTANGTVTLRACVNKECSKSTLDVSSQKDNSYFKFLLNSELNVNPGNNIMVRITKNSGNKPVAMWVWRAKGSFIRSFSLDNKRINGMSPKLTLVY